MFPGTGEQIIATILKHDNKTTSYKVALLRAINDLVLSYPGIVQHNQDVAVPLIRIAELWAAYYWAFMDQNQPIYQGARAKRDGILRNDVSFRPALTQLRTEWQLDVLTSVEPSDGFLLFAEMRTPRRRATYSATLRQAYDQAVTAIIAAVKMPIQYAGIEQWSVFPKPDRLDRLPITVLPLPGTGGKDVCLIVTASLWQTFHKLSLYIEALCIHEWSLFTASVVQELTGKISRGAVYSLLTARPDNRRPLSWERNQVDVLLLEQVPFTCPWTQKHITQSHQYDLDHLLPLAVYPINELWNLVPVDKEFNQRIKRDRVPSGERLRHAEQHFITTYDNYGKSPGLNLVMQEDATRRFTGLTSSSDFTLCLAQRAIQFIEDVSNARYVNRF